MRDGGLTDRGITSQQTLIFALLHEHVATIAVSPVEKLRRTRPEASMKCAGEVAVTRKTDADCNIADVETRFLEKKKTFAQAQFLAVVAQSESGGGVEQTRQMRRRPMQLVGQVGQR